MRIVLTRPEASARRFARDIRAAGLGGAILFAPLMEIVAVGTGPLPEGDLVFTSAQGVAAAAAMGPLAGRRVFAVGARTAAAARARGARAVSAGGDVAALAALVLARGARAVSHLHGAHVSGDLAGDLRAAGVRAEARVVYEQRPRPMGEAARAALMGSGPALLPLFSARSARLAGAALDAPPPSTFVVAISAQAREGWPWPGPALVADRPDAAGVLGQMARLVAHASRR